MDWEDRLDAWELELELTAQLEGSDWVTLERAAAETGVSRAALRNWYPDRSDSVPAGRRAARAAAAGAADADRGPGRSVDRGLRRTAERRLADEAQLEILRHRVDQLELRLAALERQAGQPLDE